MYNFQRSLRESSTCIFLAQYMIREFLVVGRKLDNFKVNLIRRLFSRYVRGEDFEGVFFKHLRSNF